MILKLFSIYDSKAQCFGSVTPARSDGEMIREFVTHANDPKSRIGQNPEDYSLMEVGTFDDTTGCIVGVSHFNHGPAAGYVRHNVTKLG